MEIKITGLTRLTGKFHSLHIWERIYQSVLILLYLILTNKKFAKPTQEIEVGSIRIHMNTGVNTRAYCNECLPKNKIVNPDKLQKTFFWGSLLKSIYSNEQRDIRNGFGVSSRGFALFPIRR